MVTVNPEAYADSVTGTPSQTVNVKGDVVCKKVFGQATNAIKLDISGFGISGLTFYQTPSSFWGSSSDWAHYIICNHGDGDSYFHYAIRLPF